MHIFPFVAFSVLFFVFYCLNYCVFSVALQDDVEFCKGEETRKKPKETERILEKVFVFGHQKRSDFVALSAVLGESGRICNGLCGNARLFHT